MRFFFDPDVLKQRLSQNGPTEYNSAHPFAHIVIDNLFPPDLLERVIADFEKVGAERWKIFENPNEKKFASQKVSDIPQTIRALLNELNGGVFVDFLEGLTGIKGLVPDPHFEGGGMHLIKTGGKLGVHADFNWHKRLKLDRRLNVILYLNIDWKDEYLGHLELWDKEKMKAVKKISPLFNRLVIFSTTSDSYHGHPEELACPHDRSRMSLALYYYTNGRPAFEKRSHHSTLFMHDKNPVPPLWMRIKNELRAWFKGRDS